MAVRPKGGSVCVTGSQEGPKSLRQVLTAFRVLVNLRRDGFRTLRHGDCVGWDALFHCLAKSLRYYVIVHPPVNETKRAHMKGDETMKPKPYLDRDDDMTRMSEVTVACPKEEHEEMRSGTWATVRMARKYKRPVFVCWPSGRLE